MRGLSAEEQIIELRTALLRIHNQVLLYAQRRAARRTLTQAVRAGALIPRDALGFIVEGYPSSDEDTNILSLRPRVPESNDESETETLAIGPPAPEVPTIAPTRTTTAVSVLQRI
jgi:hypothetical protein